MCTCHLPWCPGCPHRPEVQALRTGTDRWGEGPAVPPGAVSAEGVGSHLPPPTAAAIRAGAGGRAGRGQLCPLRGARCRERGAAGPSAPGSPGRSEQDERPVMKPWGGLWGRKCSKTEQGLRPAPGASEWPVAWGCVLSYKQQDRVPSLCRPEQRGRGWFSLLACDFSVCDGGG